MYLTFDLDLVHVQLATLTHTKHTYMWVKNKNTTSCMQQNTSTEMTSDVLDRKLNKEIQICNFSSFFNEKGIPVEIW
jgi:hypothetical protein